MFCVYVHVDTECNLTMRKDNTGTIYDSLILIDFPMQICSYLLV